MNTAVWNFGVGTIFTMSFIQVCDWCLSLVNIKDIYTKSLILLILLVQAKKENDMFSPGSLRIYTVTFNAEAKDTKQKT